MNKNMKKEIKIKEYPIQLAGMIWGEKQYFCSFCKSIIFGFKDRLSAQEFRISGLCQECQDKSFIEENEAGGMSFDDHLESIKNE